MVFSLDALHEGLCGGSRGRSQGLEGPGGLSPDAGLRVSQGLGQPVQVSGLSDLRRAVGPAGRSAGLGV